MWYFVYSMQGHAIDKFAVFATLKLPMTNLLLEEELVSFSNIPSTLRNKLRGVVRFVDKYGKTYGLFLDKNAMEELLEELEYATPEFWRAIEKSRKSGRVSAKAVEARLGL